MTTFNDWFRVQQVEPRRAKPAAARDLDRVVDLVRRFHALWRAKWPETLRRDQTSLVTQCHY